jgi:hypothetical protein
MEKRVFTTDSDTAQDNNTGDMQQAWASDETLPVPADNKYKKAVDAFGQMLYADLVRERDELKVENQEKNKENVRLREENDKLHRLTSNQALELQDCKDKIIQLQSLFNSQMEGEPTISNDVLHFEYDVVHFDEYITIEQINNVFLNLQKLTDIKTAPDQYLINNASAVVPIYLLLTESKKIPEIYRYKGTKSDFCREWNSNVASRIPDKDRSQALTIEYDSFKAECNRAPWKGSSPANWNRDKVDSKHKVKLDRAVNTKKHLERLFT